MPTLDDLPPYRRAKLLWEFAHRGEFQIDQMVRERAGKPCRMAGGQKPSSPRVAMLGGDSRYHLMSGGRMLCADSQAEQCWQHRQVCAWTQTPRGPGEGFRVGGVYNSVEIRWFVQAGADGVPLSSVPAVRRCPGGPYESFHFWPPPPAKTPVVQRLRSALVEALGADCHLCGALPGAMVDHDYSTGMVRGLLCRLCNRTVEECPHVDGCPRADYMNNPPAAYLELPYPPYLAYEPKASTRHRKIELLGSDPLAEWRPARP